MSAPVPVIGYWAVCAVCIVNKALLGAFVEEWVCPRCAEVAPGKRVLADGPPIDMADVRLADPDEWPLGQVQG